MAFTGSAFFASIAQVLPCTKWCKLYGQIVRILFILVLLGLCSFAPSCRQGVPDQYLDGTTNEVSKTNTQWMDSYWDSGDGISRFENVDQRVGPDRRP